MSDERPIFSAGAFNPEAFAEWWLEHEWEKVRPHEFRCFVVGQRLIAEREKNDRS